MIETIPRGSPCLPRTAGCCPSLAGFPATGATGCAGRTSGPSRLGGHGTGEHGLCRHLGLPPGHGIYTIVPTIDCLRALAPPPAVVGPDTGDWPDLRADCGRPSRYMNCAVQCAHYPPWQSDRRLSCSSARCAWAGWLRSFPHRSCRGFIRRPCMRHHHRQDARHLLGMRKRPAFFH